MLDDEQLARIVDLALQAAPRAWHGYDCRNEVQSLRRVSLMIGDVYEVQLNELKHAEVPHSHGCDMTSIMLRKGYRWFLRQSGAFRYLELNSAAGSIVRMGANDSHFIPAVPSFRVWRQCSLSFCVFEKQTDWHLHYPRLPADICGRIVSDGRRRLRRWRQRLELADGKTTGETNR